MMVTAETKRATGVVTVSAPANGEGRPSLLDRFSRPTLNLELGNDYLIWSRTGSRQGSITNGGIIVDSALGTADGACALIKQLTQREGIGRAHINLQLSLTDAMLRTYHVAVVPKNELGKVVLWEAERVFPFKPSEDLFAWRIIDTVEWGSSRKHHIQAAAVPPHRLQPLFGYLRNSHTVESVVLTATAWESYLTGLKTQFASSPDECCAAIVRLLGNRLSVFCLHNGTVEFTREALLDSVDIGKAFEASLAKLSGDAFSTDRLYYQSLDVDELARTVAEELDFYYGQFTQRSVRRVFIALPPEIQDAARTTLSESLGVSVIPLVPAATSTSTSIENNYLFIPGKLPLNKAARKLGLVPEEIKRDQLERRRFRSSLGLAALALIALLVAWLLQAERLQSVRNYHDSLKQLTDAQLGSPVYQQLTEMRAAGETWRIQWQQFRQATNHYSRLLKLVSNTIPTNTFMTSTQTVSSHPSGTPGFVDATLNGFVSSRARYPEIELVQFIEDLKNSALVSKVDLHAYRRELGSDGNRLNFTLQVRMN